jgi:hypothetical protein
MFSFFTGLWPIVWHVVVGLGLGCIALAFAYFSPFWKLYGVITAVAIFVATVAYIVGVGNGETRQAAQCHSKLTTIAKAPRIPQPVQNEIGGMIAGEALKAFPGGGIIGSVLGIGR